jgi:hypothetical protein
VLSSTSELGEIARILRSYVRLPFSSINIPGAVVEGVVAHVRKASVLRTYDFVDVVDRLAGFEWQVKSTLAETPVTWKRAKIPERLELIAASENSDKGLQALGDAIIGFCNRHAEESLRLYDLKAIGYARLVIHKNDEATYFERILCTREHPRIFEPDEFIWRWSMPRRTPKKEQLTALHGMHAPTGKKWFAWHGRGENQLHFNGDRYWWPQRDGDHAITFPLPASSERFTLESFIDLLALAGSPPSHR